MTTLAQRGLEWGHSCNVQMAKSKVKDECAGAYTSDETMRSFSPWGALSGRGCLPPQGRRRACLGCPSVAENVQTMLRHGIVWRNNFSTAPSPHASRAPHPPYFKPDTTPATMDICAQTLAAAPGLLLRQKSTNASQMPVSGGLPEAPSALHACHRVGLSQGQWLAPHLVQQHALKRPAGQVSGGVQVEVL